MAMEPTNDLLIKIARIRMEEAQAQLNYGAPTAILDGARVDLRLAELALEALQDKGKPPAQPVAEVVAWSHPQSPRTCDIRALRPDIAPGLLYDAPPAPALYGQGIDDAATWVDAQRESYDNEHGYHDRHTGSFEFGNDAQREYSGTLSEIAEGIRALHPRANPKDCKL